MQRSYNLRTIAVTGTAQPVVGTTLSAAAPVSSVEQSLAVVDSSIFDQGQWALLDISPNEERVMVLSIPDSTHILVQGILQGAGCQIAHAINAIVRPSRLINALYVQPTDGNTAPMWIGTGPGLTTAGVAAVKKLLNVAANSQPPDFLSTTMPGAGANPYDLAEFWIVGTNPNTYLAAASIV